MKPFYEPSDIVLPAREEDEHANMEAKDSRFYIAKRILYGNVCQVRLAPLLCSTPLGQEKGL